MRLCFMRIAFIGQKGIPVSQGGVERHVEELARRLALRGHKVIVYNRATYKKGEGELPVNIKIVRVPSLHIKAWDNIIGTFLSSLDVIFRRVDVIHYHHMGPAFFMWLPKIFRPSVRLVFTHHSDGTGLPYWGYFARLAMKLGEKIAMRLSDDVIVVSPAMGNKLKLSYDRNVKAIPSGVTVIPESNEETRVPSKFILAVARLVKAKGLDHLVRAFRLIAPDYPDYDLVVVGGPTKTDNELPRLLKLAEGESRIHFLGRKNSRELAQIYRKASVFVQPSEIEGLPITLLEAASYKLPIIASDIPEHTVILL